MTPAAIASAMEAAKRTRMALLHAALELDLAERKVGEARGTVRLLKAETEFDLAARNHVNAVDDLPPQQQPRTWELP